MFKADVTTKSVYIIKYDIYMIHTHTCVGIYYYNSVCIRDTDALAQWK